MNPSIADLAKTELFRDVSDADLLRVLEHVTMLELRAGEILLSPERANHHVYLLLSGSLSLRFDAPDSPEVRELAAGISVGEMSVIDDAPPSAYIIVKEACRVLPIHRDLIQQLVADSSPVARNLLRLMGQWVKANTRYIANDQTQIQHLTATIRRVTAQGLDQRVPSAPEGQDFIELIGVFNDMLERLERGFKQASRFSGDAAHELKTPLAILQGQIERAMHQAGTGSSMQEMLSNILDEVCRLSSISKKLLLLSHADAGRMSLHRMPFDLSLTLMGLVEDVRMLAPNLRVSEDIASAIHLEADSDLMRNALYNLVSNAIKYNLEGGWIHISASKHEGYVKVDIANASCDISEVDRALLFERFYRADPARSRNIEGSGLGLSLAREILRTHGGDLTLEDSSAGETRFSLKLPADLNSAPWEY